jgi:non-ribosomal peptide synthetase component F
MKTKQIHTFCTILVQVSPTDRNREEVLSLAQGDKIPIGLPVDNTRAYLLDENLNPVEVGERGSLYIAGAHLCGGFVTGSASAHDPFLENRYDEAEGDLAKGDGRFSQLIRMGDFCSNVGGRLYYEGRLDSQVHVPDVEFSITQIP